VLPHMDFTLISDLVLTEHRAQPGSPPGWVGRSVTVCVPPFFVNKHLHCCAGILLVGRASGLQLWLSSDVAMGPCMWTSDLS